MDEQEATRFLLLSPEADAAKLKESVWETIRYNADRAAYKNLLDSHPGRQMLKERIRAIRDARIKGINLSSELAERINEWMRSRVLKPRHQRDVVRLMDMVKGFALFNMWHRERVGDTITATEADLTEATAIWEKIYESQELNLAPVVYNIFKEIIAPLFATKNGDRNETVAATTGLLGLTRQEILDKYFEIHGRRLNPGMLRQDIIPNLESAGLIYQEHDQQDKRKVLVFVSSSGKEVSTAQENQHPDLPPWLEPDSQEYKERLEREQKEAAGNIDAEGGAALNAGVNEASCVGSSPTPRTLFDNPGYTQDPDAEPEVYD